MKERKTLKEGSSQHIGAIKLVILVILAIAVFIGGYFVSWNFMNKPLNDSQFKLYKQVARYVYAQKENVIVEEPEVFYVRMTTNTITVQADNNQRGMVIAKLQNGELVTTQNIETGDAVVSSILMGVSFVIVAIFIGVAAYGIYGIYKK